MKDRRTYRLAFLSVALACGVLPACQQKMAVQPSYREDEASSFYADGRASRPLLPGTIARGHLRTDSHFFSGTRQPASQNWAFPAALVGVAGHEALGGLTTAAVQENNAVDMFPFPITLQVLEHGQHRYMIYCVVCHDALGTADGRIVQRGYTPPPSFHIERLRQVPVGHFFDVITNGYGSMPEYKQQIPPQDRWAIAAYIRALQLSQHFPSSDLTAEMRRQWQEQDKVLASGRAQP